MLPNPKKTFTFRIDKSIKERLIKLARETGRSTGWLIRAAIQQYLDRYGSSDK